MQDKKWLFIFYTGLSLSKAERYNSPSFTIWLTGLPGAGKTTLARNFAREQIPKFVEVYLYCSAEQREKRLEKLGNISAITPELYQPPTMPELSIDTSDDYPELSAMHLISYLEQHSYLAPLWEDIEAEDEEIAIIKTRLQAMGYLE